MSKEPRAMYGGDEIPLELGVSIIAGPNNAALANLVALLVRKGVLDTREVFTVFEARTEVGLLPGEQETN